MSISPGGSTHSDCWPRSSRSDAGACRPRSGRASSTGCMSTTASRWGRATTPSPWRLRSSSRLRASSRRSIASVDGRLEVFVVPADKQLDLRAAGKRVVLADRAAAERATGYVIGGISPLGPAQAPADDGRLVGERLGDDSRQRRSPRPADRARSGRPRAVDGRARRGDRALARTTCPTRSSPRSRRRTRQAPRPPARSTRRRSRPGRRGSTR